MLQELLHWQPVRHVNRVLEVRGGDDTSTQPQSTAIAQGRKAQTYDLVRDKVRSQPGRKTTKRTAIARGHSNQKRGRQGYRHTSQDASGSDCRDYKAEQMTESWKSEEGDRKSTQSLVESSVQGTAPYGKYEVGTRRSPGNWHHGYVRNVAQENRKHWPELQSHTAKWRRPTRSGVRRYRWSHRNSPRAPMEPNARGDAPPQKPNAHQWQKPSAKTRCKRGDSAMGTINETNAKNGWGHAQDKTRERQQSPPQKRTRPPPRRSEGWNESDSDRASNWGTNARKETDPWRGRTKQRGKNSRRLAAAGRITASAPAATGRQENLQAEAKASPEGKGSKPKKKQPADRRQSRAGGPGSGPTAKGAQWREPRIPKDP